MSCWKICIWLAHQYIRTFKIDFHFSQVNPWTGSQNHRIFLWTLVCVWQRETWCSFFQHCLLLENKNKRRDTSSPASGFIINTLISRHLSASLPVGQPIGVEQGERAGRMGELRRSGWQQVKKQQGKHWAKSRRGMWGRGVCFHCQDTVWEKCSTRPF